jgi:Alpha/beta hydrolase domain
MAMRQFWTQTACGALTAVVMAGSVRAEVTKVEIVSVQHAALEGKAFGDIGTYDRIKARVTVAVDPADRRNAVIADIALAPRNAAGKVEAVADVEILKPSDARRGNHTIFYEVVNRGHKLAPGIFNDASSQAMEKAADAGNGYLLREGYTLVWSGWQGDIPSKAGDLALSVPTLKDVTGRIQEELLFDNLTSPIIATLSWPASDMTSAKLTVRAQYSDAPTSPPDMSFRFVDPLHIEITRPAGFDAGALYQIDYVARDPKVLGLGFAATRDIVAFLRREGSTDNPLAAAGRSTIQRAYVYGQSQSGRFLREYLYLGFNEDLSGKPVFDGMLPHIGGARFTATNLRFGNPGRNPRHPQDPASITDRFPFTYGETTDPFTGTRDSLMTRCRSTRTCPKIIQVDSEYEWWSSRASLLVTDPTGKPLSLPPDVRLFMTAGTPHLARLNAVAQPSKQCMMPLNPLHQGVTLRAQLHNLDAWVVRGVAPPDSRTPNLADGTLVDAKLPQLETPIPGLPYTGMHIPAAAEDLSVSPSKILGEYKVYVPRLNADGNILGGIHLPVIDVPKATYTGWNPHAVGFAPTTLCPLQGGVVAFAATRETRLQSGDPRPSLEERYPSQKSYVGKVDAVARSLVRQRLMLAEDLPRQHQAALDDTLAKLGRTTAAADEAE